MITMFRIILWQQFEIMKMRKQLRAYGQEAIRRQQQALSSPFLHQLMGGNRN